MDRIEIDNSTFLSQIRLEDTPLLIEYLNDKEIYDNTCYIPYPYEEADARQWIEQAIHDRRTNKKLISWAIRDKDSHLLGGIGFKGEHLTCGVSQHTDEISFWLGRPHWSKGIMTKVVKKVCEIGFSDYNLYRIEAKVFMHNQPSVKVLEKCGFEMEGINRMAYFKNREHMDGMLFALINKK